MSSFASTRVQLRLVPPEGTSTAGVCEVGSAPAARADPYSSFTRSEHLDYGERGTGNALIHAENLSALRALRPHFSGKVRCIYIDPPYNNQERYHHYEDARSHHAWLDMVASRVEQLRPLLARDGSLWISIDDREVHYLKVAMDEIFGRERFVATIVWEQRLSRENRKVFSSNHEYLLVYALDPKSFRASRGWLPATPEVLARYKNPDNDPRGPWQSISANVQDGHATKSQFYEIIGPNGRSHRPPEGRCWIYNKERMVRELAAGNVWFGKDGRGVPRLKRFQSEAQVGLTPHTLWRADEVGTTDEAKKQQLALFPDERVFDTPKPEGLISRILALASHPGELVLDAFLGSGTTAAVAHKLRRRYIGIEKGDHAVTHCAARLRKVVDGDPTGISAAVDWKGGGGFDFFRGSI